MPRWSYETWQLSANITTKITTSAQTAWGMMRIKRPSNTSVSAETVDPVALCGSTSHPERSHKDLNLNHILPIIIDINIDIAYGDHHCIDKTPVCFARMVINCWWSVMRNWRPRPVCFARTEQWRARGEYPLLPFPPIPWDLTPVEPEIKQKFKSLLNRQSHGALCTSPPRYHPIHPIQSIHLILKRLLWREELPQTIWNRI